MEKVIKEFYPNGNIKKEISFNDVFVVEGVVKEYFEDGQIYTEEVFVDGIPNGNKITYHKNGIIKSIHPYKNGQVCGTCTVWNKSGNKTIELEVFNGKKKGLCKRWNAREYIETYYNDQTTYGVFRYFYLMDGFKHALFRTFNSNGMSNGVEVYFKEENFDETQVIHESSNLDEFI